MTARRSTEDIARAIGRRHTGGDIVDLLARDLAPSELGSLLLHALRERARRTSAPDVLRFAERTPLVHASDADARCLHRFDALAFEAADEFEVVELSPVGVLGMNAAAGVDQNNVLSATRGTEVMADPTTALAVECARRRRGDLRHATLRLACSHRLVRMQPFEDPGFRRHFRLFALAHAGRDEGDERFELAALREQLRVYLRLSDAMRAAGFGVHATRLEVSDTRIVLALLAERGADLAKLRGHVSPMQKNTASRLGVDLPPPDPDPARAMPPGRPRDLERLARVEREVFTPLRANHPGVETRFDLGKLHGLHYYDGLTLTVVYRVTGDRELPVGDGGFTTWTQALLSDKKQRFLGSAIGSELLCRLA
jgi:hypothetical protein